MKVVERIFKDRIRQHTDNMQFGFMKGKGKTVMGPDIHTINSSWFLFFLPILGTQIDTVDGLPNWLLKEFAPILCDPLVFTPDGMNCTVLGHKPTLDHSPDLENLQRQFLSSCQ